MGDFDRKVYPYMPNSYDSGTITTVQPLIPYGEVTFNASDRNPYGMLICDGEIWDKNAYPDLYYALGTNYNAVTTPTWTNTSLGANDFKIPNLIAAFPFGGALGAASGANTINTTTNLGGASTVALTPANIASHAHSYTAPSTTNFGPSLAGQTGGNGTYGANTGAAIVNSAGTQVTASGSNGSPFSIIPPYISLTPLIRADYSAQANYVVGFVNVTSVNNRFWCRLTSQSGVNYTGIVTIAQGAYSPARFITALNNAISAFCAASPLGQTTILMGYSYSGTGRYVFKIYCGTFNVAIEPDFTTQFGTTSTIPQANLDLCADLLGF